MRVFLGFPIDEKVREICKGIESELEKTGVRMKLVEPENLHVTLKFLGDIDEGMLPNIKNVLDSIDARPFQAETTQVGCFPNTRFIRVVWLGVESKDILKIQGLIDNALVEFGFQREKEYIPHITLARIKERPNKELLAVIGKENKTRFRIDRVQLIESHLSRRGPRYDVVYERVL